MSNICYIRRNKRHNTCIISSSKCEGLSEIVMILKLKTEVEDKACVKSIVCIT